MNDPVSLCSRDERLDERFLTSQLAAGKWHYSLDIVFSIEKYNPYNVKLVIYQKGLPVFQQQLSISFNVEAKLRLRIIYIWFFQRLL